MQNQRIRFLIVSTVTLLLIGGSAPASWCLTSAVRKGAEEALPNVSRAVLRHDEQAFDSVYPQIRDYYKTRGLGEERTDEALVDAWIRHRRGDATGSLSAPTALSITVSYGLLSVQTTPAGASVFLDKEDIKKTTPTSVMVRSGWRVIRFEKKGYKVATRTADVSAGEETKVSQMLEPEGVEE